MPACLTHYYFAKNVLEELPDQESLNRCAYDWGAQGPDFLFCHRYFPFMKGKSLKEYGHKLHTTKPSETLNAMREFLKRHDDPAYRSYVLGFLCHYSLDSTAHPYINFLAGELAKERPCENASTMHGEIEAALDAITLRYETGKLPSEVNLKRAFPKNEGVQRKIAKLYRDVIFTVYGEDVSEEELFRATKDAHFVFACVTDRTGLKHKAFDILEKGRPHYVTSHIVPITERDDLDYANIRHASWGQGESVSQQSFFELYGEALGVAGKLIRGFETSDLSALTGEKPFG